MTHVLREPQLPEEATGAGQPDLAIWVIYTPSPLGLLTWDPPGRFFIQGLVRVAWLPRTASLCFVLQGRRVLSTQAQDDKRPIEATEAYSSCSEDQGPPLEPCQSKLTSWPLLLGGNEHLAGSAADQGQSWQAENCHLSAPAPRQTVQRVILGW